MLANDHNAGRLKNVTPVLLTMALIILGLVYGRAFLIPIVIALFIATLIGAASDRLRSLGFPRQASTLTAVLILLIGIAIILNILANQVDAVANAWPRYVARLEQIASDALGWVGPNLSKRITDSLGTLDLIERVPGLVGSAGGFVASLALVAIYVGFLLSERGRLSGKVDQLFATSEQTANMRHAIADISNSIRGYLWIKTIMSLLTCGVSYAVLKLLHVDFAETWALIIFLLNYIPSIGSALGVLFPALLALVQFETAWQFFVIAGLLASAQLIIGNVIEPAFMGRTLNLSPFVVIASLAFWSMIWGIVGAFLSVPLTTALIIACSHLPSFRWIAILLSADGKTGLDPLAEKIPPVAPESEANGTEASPSS